MNAGQPVEMQSLYGDYPLDQAFDEMRAPNGELLAVEVKSGAAIRSASQLRKDAAMARTGGKLIGKNAPIDLLNQDRVIQTIERH